MPAKSPPTRAATNEAHAELPKVLTQLGRQSDVINRKLAELDKLIEDRRALMSRAHDMGASFRQIAKATKVAPQTVINQLNSGNS